mmetsp:Transcript_42348/g.59311  ORF Transcript_42348/g.59311 Transcript_42348/m.59311 type:complete len:119 (-) Transcript_42348:10-366(-)
MEERKSGQEMKELEDQKEEPKGNGNLKERKDEELEVGKERKKEPKEQGELEERNDSKERKVDIQEKRQKPRFCNQFRRSGKCSYGEKCKFSHEVKPKEVKKKEEEKERGRDSSPVDSR